MKPLILVLFLVVGLLGGLLMNNPLESHFAHIIAAHLDDDEEVSVSDIGDQQGVWSVWQTLQKLWGTTLEKPDYCQDVLREAPRLEDAQEALKEPGAIYCPGFDYTTDTCREQQKVITQAIKRCFSSSYCHIKRDQIQSI